MIVYKDIPGYRNRETIEKILYLLWDSGMELGHRVHEVEELPEAAKSDITIKTALLESRFIDGSKFLWTEVENTLNLIRKSDTEEFICAKLSERAEMQKRYPLTMEPNLKEGVGGFRDANSVYWIGNILYNITRIKDLDDSIIEERDYREFRMALEFLFRVRSALHILNRKKVDRVRLEQLPDIARLLKYDPTPLGHMRFARKLIDQLKTIHIFSRIWIYELAGSFAPELYENLLYPQTEGRNLREIISILRSHADTPFTAHPMLLQSMIHANKEERPDIDMYEEAGKIFRCEHSHSILKALWEARILRHVVPPLKKVISLPQFDGYHRYSVDIHSLETLREMENIEDEKLSELFEKLEEDEKWMLKIVALLHDSGKGRKKDHHLVGASLFVIFAKKIGMDDRLVSMGELLIQYHTVMSVTAQREDIYSEKVILRFASRFGSEKMLDMIYLLTYADMRAVGNDIYNSYTAKLLSTLHKNALEALSNAKLLDETARRLKKIESLQRSPSFRNLPAGLRRKILSIPSNAFFIRHGTRRIIAIAQAASETENYSYIVGNEKYLTIEIIRRHDLNLAWLLHRLRRLQVVSMEITKLYDEIKYFKIDFNEKLDESELPYLESTIEDSFSPHPELKLSRPDISRDEIEVDCDHSREYGVMKLRAKDQPGLLAYLIDLFDRTGVDIASAKIHTLKGRVNDLFLIEKNGNFCHNIEKIIARLTERECAE
jgi:[protein-PII] uridylyltransferase